MKLKTVRRAWGALLALSLLAVPVVAAPAGAVLVDVNGDKIYAADIDRMMAMIKSKEAALQTGTPEAQKALASLRETIIDNFVVQRLLTQEARRRNIVPAKADVDKGIAAYKADYADDAAFAKALAAEGKTPDDVRKIISDELALRELTTQMTADLQVTDADIAAYYKANPDEFKVPEMVRARHILIAYPDNATTAQKTGRTH